MADLSAGTVSLPVKPDTAGFAAILGRDVLSAVEKVSKNATKQWTSIVGKTTAVKALDQGKVTLGTAADVERASMKVRTAQDAEVKSAAALRLAEAQLNEARAKYATDSSKYIAAEERFNAAQRTHTAATEKVAASETALIPLQARHAEETAKLEGIHERGTTALAKFGDGFRNVGSAVAGMAGPILVAGSVATALGAASVKAAADFQTASTRLVTDAGQSQKGLAAVQAGMLKISSATGISADDIAAGMYKIESAGFHGAAGLKVMQAAAEGAKVGQADLATVSDALTTILNDYGKAAGTPIQATNALIASVSRGKVKLEELAGSLHSVLPNAQALKIPLNDVLGALSTMTQEGISADQATQNLNHTIVSLANPTGVMRDEMASMGLSATKVAQQLGKKGITGTLEELYQAIEKRMGKAGLVVESTFNKSAQTAAAMRAAFNGLPPAVQATATAFEKGTITQKTWISSVKGMTPANANLAKEWATLRNRSKGFSEAITSGSGPLHTFTADLAKMAGGQVGLQVALHLTGIQSKKVSENVSAIGAAMAKNGKHVTDWSVVQKTFNQQMAVAKTAIENAGIKIGQALMPAIQALLPVIPKIADGIVKAIPTINALVKGFIAVAKVVGPIIGAIFDTQAGLLKFNSASNRTQVVLDGLHGKFGPVLQILGQFGVAIGTAIKWVVDLRNSVANQFTAVQNTILKNVKNWANLLSAAGRNIVDGLVNGIMGARNLITNAITTLGNLIPNTFKHLLGIHSPSTVFHNLGVNIAQGLIQGLLGTKPQIVSASDQIATVVTEMFEKKKGGISKAVETSALALLTKDTAKLAQLSGRRALMLKNITAEQDVIKNLKSEKADEASSVTTATTGLFNVTDYTSGTSMVAGLQQLVASTKQFKTLLGQLVKAGMELDPVLRTSDLARDDRVGKESEGCLLRSRRSSGVEPSSSLARVSR